MTLKRMIDLLTIERQCMTRKSTDNCDSNCAECDIVQDDTELFTMYTDVIYILSLLATLPNERLIEIAKAISDK